LLTPNWNCMITCLEFMKHVLNVKPRFESRLNGYNDNDL
jgi:hypothetical protein